MQDTVSNTIFSARHGPVPGRGEEDTSSLLQPEMKKSGVAKEELHRKEKNRRIMEMFKSEGLEVYFIEFIENDLIILII